MTVRIDLTTREIATVLHALRVYQYGVIDESATCDHFDNHGQLLDSEVDEMCERIGNSRDIALWNRYFAEIK